MTDIKVPELSESISQASLLEWKVKPGDVVHESDVLVEVETDKITMEIYAPRDGKITAIHMDGGSDVKSGDLLATLEESKEDADGEKTPATAPAAAQEAGGEEVTVTVPELSESVSEATLLTWKKQVGDAVHEGDVLVEVETDKITMEIYAPCDGRMNAILTDSDTSVKSGDKLATILAGAAGSPTATTATPTAKDDTGDGSQAAVRAMPSAKKLAKEAGVNLENVSGTGKGGRITKKDVMDLGKQAPATPAAAAPPLAVAPGERPTHRVPMSKIRARIAERLMQSQHQTATLTSFNEVNMQAVMDLRAAYKQTFADKHGVKLGFMSFFVKAAVAALKEFPVINASVDGSDVIYHEYYDIGVAVASARGLVVPILRDADVHSMATIEKMIGDFGKRAQSGALSLEEISGGTFTITNGGVFGSLLSTPILNPPQSAILGVHATKQRPVVDNDGNIVAQPMCYIALSYDHRIIDGREAVLFLVTVKNMLEDPARLLLDI